MKISEKTCVEFVDVLASKSAVPGGGGAASSSWSYRYGFR